MGRSIARLAAFAGGAIISLVLAKPAAADGLYPSDSGGVWAPDFTRCHDAAWTGTFLLGYVLNDQQDYSFDIPDPDLVPDETVTVDLAPTVVGTLPGVVEISGATTIAGQIGPEGSFGGLLDPDAEFTLSFTPGETTVGSLPVPDEWADQQEGFAAVTATITGTESGVQTIVMLAQPFMDCAIASPPPPEPEPTTSTTLPPLPPTDVGLPSSPRSGPWSVTVWTLAAAAGAIAVALGLALSRRRS